jgi:hypothetical protein
MPGGRRPTSSLSRSSLSYVGLLALVTGALLLATIDGWPATAGGIALLDLAVIVFVASIFGRLRAIENGELAVPFSLADKQRSRRGARPPVPQSTGSRLRV